MGTSGLSSVYLLVLFIVCIFFFFQGECFHASHVLFPVATLSLLEAAVEFLHLSGVWDVHSLPLKKGAVLPPWRPSCISLSRSSQGIIQLNSFPYLCSWLARFGAWVLSPFYLPVITCFLVFENNASHRTKRTEKASSNLFPSSREASLPPQLRQEERREQVRWVTALHNLSVQFKLGTLQLPLETSPHVAFLGDLVLCLSGAGPQRSTDARTASPPLQEASADGRLQETE